MTILDFLPNLSNSLMDILDSIEDEDRKNIRLNNLFIKSFDRLNKSLKKGKISQKQYSILETKLVSHIESIIESYNLKNNTSLKI